LGDFHTKNDDFTEKAMADIAVASPDLVIPLGDFGGKNIGTTEGLEQAWQHIRSIGAPMRAIMGNHDLQRETGSGPQPKGTMEQRFIELFGERSYGVIECEDYRLFFATTEPQPSDSCYQIQECYVTDGQFEFLRGKLRERPGVPVIFFTHAPIMGSGLRTVPHVHVRSTNAYMDHNHQPERWMALVKEHPEIVMWFSAHYHLSHIYPDSVVSRFGATFFTTAVHGAATRDGNRQSRVIKLVDGCATVKTLDHVERRLLETTDWASEGTLTELVEERRRVLAVGMAGMAEMAGMLGAAGTVGTGGAVGTGGSCGLADTDATGGAVSEDGFGGLGSLGSLANTKGAPGIRLLSSCAIGDGEALPGCLVALDDRRWLSGTADGYLWEIVPEYEAVMGTLHLNETVHSVTVDGERIWFAADNRVYLKDARDPWRFFRLKEDDRQRTFVELPEPARSLTVSPTGSLWAVCGGAIYEIGPDSASGSELQTQRVCELPDDTAKLADVGGELRILTTDGRLYRWSQGAEQPEPVADHVADWDGFGDMEARIVRGGNQWHIHGADHRTGKQWTKKWDRPEVQAGVQVEFQAKIACLGDANVLLNVDGAAYFINLADPNIIPVPIPAGTKVTAMARAYDQNRVFALTIAAGDPPNRPRLMRWDYSILA
jgi:hypothetical protein